MSNEIPTFAKLCEKAAEDFVRTLVVIDNEARLGETEEEKPTKLKTPSSRKVSKQDELGIESDSIVTEQILEAKSLVENASDKGIVCSILKPSDNEDLEQTILKAAQNSDICVIDWQLGDDGEKAKKYISKIIIEDIQNNGRLRLLAVYTGLKTISSICDQVAQYIKEKISVDIDKEEYLITGPHFRVIFLIKSHVDGLNEKLETYKVDESELTQRLIEEFSLLSQGILPNLAMSSIGAIRDTTHKFLARFHKDLDGAFLTHRALIPNSGDATEYALNLIGSDIKSILKVHEVGEKYSGTESIKLWLDEKKNSGHKFKLRYISNNNREAEKDVEYEHVKTILENGIILAQKDNDSIELTNRQKKYFSSVFVSDAAQAKNLDIEFYNLDTVERGLYSKPDDWIPCLKLGSIVQRRTTQEYFICMQPLCDAVRIKEGSRPFPFLPLFEDRVHYDCAVEIERGQYLRLKVKTSPYNLVMLEFAPAEDGSEVVKTKKRDGLYFSANGVAYNWIADLKESFSIRLAQKVANSLSRIAVDEYELLRDKNE